MKSRSVHFEIKDSIQITDVHKFEAMKESIMQQKVVGLQDAQLADADPGLHSLEEGDPDPGVFSKGLTPKFHAQ